MVSLSSRISEAWRGMLSGPTDNMGLLGKSTHRKYSEVIQDHAESIPMLRIEIICSNLPNPPTW